VGLVPIVIGDALAEGETVGGAPDLALFWMDPLFRGNAGRLSQLQLFECLAKNHSVVGQLGATTAGMDGPALMGMPTLYLTDAPNPRMRQWDGCVPGYREVVRSDGYVERIQGVLRQWGTADAVA
jgi:hypothetical protein